MKKTSAWMFVACFAVGLVAACGGAGESDEVEAIDAPDVEAQACTTQCIYNCWQRYGFQQAALEGCKLECCGSSGWCEDCVLHPEP